ncbi:MAG: RHS repeat-associated core domain-containing protein, partial [Actinomycetota bacterium]
LFDPYGTQLNNPTPTPANTPDYAWQATTNAETENLDLPYTAMGARIYLPQLGRFTSPDPKPGVSGSEYTYARSDPINYTDPDGLSPKHNRTSFSDWWKTNFVDFWTHDIPKGWHWAFGSDASWWHGLIGFVVILAVVAVIVLAIYFAPVILAAAADAISTAIGAASSAISYAASALGLAGDEAGGIGAEIDGEVIGSNVVDGADDGVRVNVNFEDAVNNGFKPSRGFVYEQMLEESPDALSDPSTNNPNVGALNGRS